MSKNKHKNRRPENNFYNRQDDEKQEENEDIEDVNGKTEETSQNSNEEKEADTPLDPYPEKEDDLSPPQDLNLKLQLEKENSLALTNMLKTLQADFDNYRKRNQKSQDEAYENGVMFAAKRMLSCFDAVEGAINQIKDETTKEGLEILRREFLSALKDLNIIPIETDGQMFDANLHNAIGTEEMQGKPAGLILHEVQKGFKMNDKVVRYSLVIIAK